MEALILSKIVIIYFKLFKRMEASQRIILSWSRLGPPKQNLCTVRRWCVLLHTIGRFEGGSNRLSYRSTHEIGMDIVRRSVAKPNTIQSLPCTTSTSSGRHWHTNQKVLGNRRVATWKNIYKGRNRLRKFLCTNTSSRWLWTIHRWFAIDRRQEPIRQIEISGDATFHVTQFEIHQKPKV